MTWLAADFDYERKFRSASLRRVSRAVDRYHHEKESAEKLRANQEQAAIRRRASAMAKQVPTSSLSAVCVILYAQGIAACIIHRIHCVPMVIEQYTTMHVPLSAHSSDKQRCLCPPVCNFTACLL